MARKGWQVLSGAINLVTEPCDFITNLHNAITAPDTKGFSLPKGAMLRNPTGGEGKKIPGDPWAPPPSEWTLAQERDLQMQRKLFRRRGYRAPTCQDKLNEVYEYADNVDVGVAMKNFLKAQAQDFIFGSIGQLGGKASARLGNRTGRLTGIETGPLF